MTYPSVTQVLGPWQDFSRVCPDKLAAACERGSVLHRAFASHALGLWKPELPPEYQGYFNSFARWFDNTVEETLTVEGQLFCKKYRFCGHPDWIGIIKGDKSPTLIDWKTGQVQMKGHRLQIAAYHHLAQEAYGVKRVLLVHPKPDGKVAKVPEHSGTLAHDFSLFLNALAVFKYFKGGTHGN